MRKRKKFHELRYPKRGVSKNQSPTEQTQGTVLLPPAATQSTSGENYIHEENRAEIERRENGLIRIARMHGSNIPDREDEIEIKNERMHYDRSWTGCKIEDSLIMLTDIKTGFFRECVETDGGGWYGHPNRQHLERYGLNPCVYNERKFKAEHIPVVEAQERENLVVRLIYRKAYHRATAHITAFGKSTEVFVQECWFKCYLPWRCLERDIPRSVEVANNILQELEPEVKEQVKIVQPKIKVEMKLRKASGDYDGDAFFAPAGVPRWADIPPPETRGELNQLELFYEEDRAANRRFKEKQDAHDKEKIGPKGSYSINDVYNREISLEDLQKRAAAKRL